MRAEKVVSFLLNDDTTVASIVDEKIFGGVARQGTPAPLLVYAKQGAQRRPDLDAAETVVTAALDILVVARTYEELKELGEAVRLAISFKYGTIAGIEVIETRPSEDSEGPDEFDPELGEHAQVWTYVVVHTE